MPQEVSWVTRNLAYSHFTDLTGLERRRLLSETYRARASVCELILDAGHSHITLSSVCLSLKLLFIMGMLGGLFSFIFFLIFGSALLFELTFPTKFLSPAGEPV
jgi:hypothetical protein